MDSRSLAVGSRYNTRAIDSLQLTCAHEVTHHVEIPVRISRRRAGAVRLRFILKNAMLAVFRANRIDAIVTVREVAAFVVDESTDTVGGEQPLKCVAIERRYVLQSARTDTLWHTTTRSVAATILAAVFIRAVCRFIPRATSLAPCTGFGTPSASTRLANETIRHYVACIALHPSGVNGRAGDMSPQVTRIWRCWPQC
jgi:hypothetical protein